MQETKQDFCPNIIQRNKDLSQVLFSKTGGKAKYYICPDSLKQMYSALKFCRDENKKLVVIGKGTNVLFSDKTFDGLVVQTTKAKGHHFCGAIFSVISGTSVKQAVRLSIEQGFSGLEPFLGTAGTIGGAIANNTTVENSSICDHLLYIDIMNEDRNIVRLSKEMILPRFRDTNIKKENICILEASFALSPSNNSSSCIVRAFDLEKQSLLSKKPCIGPLFKNKDSYNLIKESKLLSKKGNNCHISRTKGNYIINDGSATSLDLYNLYKEVKQIVEEKTKVKLIPNITLIGDFD